MPLRSSSIPACAAVSILASALFAAAEANARTVKCKSVNYIIVEASSRDDVRQACRAAQHAGSFLSSQGLTLPQEDIRIDVVSAMPESIPGSAAGAYSQARRRIFILSYRSFKERYHNPLGVSMSKSIYRSVTTHEVAHAIASHNFALTPTLVAQEYIGFVTLFSTMHKGSREQILRRYSHYNDEWLTHPEILYLGDPVEFGVHAYRHYLLPENGRKILHRILQGEIFARDN